MRVLYEKERHALGMLRFLNGRWGEFAYIILGIRGLQVETEFPSDWHKQRAGWVRVSLGLLKVGIAFPWPWVVPDEYQCSGPTYGFVFFDTGLHLRWGKCKGRRDDPMTIIAMPWEWRHREHKVLGEPSHHLYQYVLRSGEVQYRVATITEETRLYTRPWLPHRWLSRSIDIKFSGEVGERSGSWKGGTIGCSYKMQPHETPLAALRRMERERKF